MNLPQVGQYLYASCSDEDYGKILAVGLDENGTPVLDIELFHPSDLSWTEDDDLDFPQPDLHTIELPDSVRPILRSVQYRLGVLPGYVICRTPGNGCFRCTKLFKLEQLPRALRN